MAELFQIHPADSRITRITDAAGTHMYLVRGDREAALLDTGVGYGRLDEVVRSLTDLPVKTFITHGHVDHAMGAGAFADAWISPLDRALYLEHSDADVRLGYLRGNAGSSGMSARDIAPELLQPVKPFEEFHPLLPGDRFDLGGVTVEILEGRGHTPGCVTMLLPELRTLLMGDACNPFTFLFDETCSTVEEYREMLLRLRPQVEGRFDRVLLCHGPGGEGTVRMIDNVIAVCDDILAGNVDDAPFTGFHGEPVCIAKAMDERTFTRVDGGEGNVVYNPARIREG